VLYVPKIRPIVTVTLPPRVRAGGYAAELVFARAIDMLGSRRMDVGELKPVEATALLTTYARAFDNRRPRSILSDTLADEVVGKIDYDFAGLGVT
jgi:hypothetical protein